MEKIMANPSGLIQAFTNDLNNKVVLGIRDCLIQGTETALSDPGNIKVDHFYAENNGSGARNPLYLIQNIDVLSSDLFLLEGIVIDGGIVTDRWICGFDPLEKKILWSHFVMKESGSDEDDFHVRTPDFALKMNSAGPLGLSGDQFPATWFEK